MRKFLLMCCLFLGLAAVSHAQGRSRKTPEEQAKDLQTQLKLNDDQTAKITAIYQARAKSLDSLMQAGGDRSSFRPIMQGYNDKIKAVLTPDQATAWEKMMADMRARRQQGGGGGGN